MRLLGFLRPYKVSLAVSVVLAVGSQAAGMAIPWLVGEIIDGPLVDRNGRQLALYVGLILMFGFVKALLMVGRRLISGRQALGWMTASCRGEGAASLTVAVRDFWQNFPKAIEAAPDGASWR